MKWLGNWLGRKTLVYVLLVGAILAAPLVWRWIDREWSTGGLRADTMSATEIRAEVKKAVRTAQNNLQADAASIRKLGSDQLVQELAISRVGRSAATKSLEDCGGWFDKFRPSRILTCKRLEIERAYYDRKIEALESAQQANTATQFAKQIGKTKFSLIPNYKQISDAEKACTAASQAAQKFRKRWKVDQWVRNLRSEQARLKRIQDNRCDRFDQLITHRNEALKRNAELKRDYADARKTMQQAENWTAGTIAEIDAGIDGRAMGDALRLAGFALLGIIFTPLLIRTLLYWVLAPLAERRGAIRLRVPGGRGGPIPASPRSAPSIGVRLRDGEELLVRQGYFQTRSLVANPRYRILLSWRHPLASFASGMYGLTAIRAAGQETTVSATRDPFAEVTLLELPDGASCVLQPRALAAVAQPIRRPLRIKGRWRLLTLNAWLTGQLRYLVFHGPVRLVIKGARGVRVERAAQGRVFAQDQLVGFSADLAYAVTRTETFIPYLMGREPLLKDKVEAGTGVVIIEETPLAGAEGTSERRGLEGIIDATLKLFGI